MANTKTNTGTFREATTLSQVPPGTQQFLCASQLVPELTEVPDRTKINCVAVHNTKNYDTSGKPDLTKTFNDTRSMNKPFETYNGGKEQDGTFQKIINIMPPHDIYIEAFLGNGAIYRKKKPAFLSSIGIDLDIQVIERWYELKIPIPELINSDAISFLKSFRPLCSILKKLGVRVLIYLDPPYPKSSRRNPQNLYRHEMTDQEHQTLLIYILRLDANIIISSYPNHIYDKYLNTWNNFTFQAQTRGGPATEKVWYNYPEPTELHDYRYIGNDFREREQLKGIVTRNVAKFKRLPELQRNAIIHQLKTKKLI